ncbi:MAG: MFS transporter [Burkholderiaceae bacterium]
MNQHSSSSDLKDLFANKSFVRFWLSRVGAGVASQMLMVALAWQMYDLTSSAWDLGLVGLYQFCPALVLSLLAGHVADRFSRKNIVMITWFLQALVVLGVVLALGQDALTRDFLLFVSLVLGIVRAFQNPAQQAILPTLVETHHLPRAMALNSMGYQASVMAGPAIGGLLFAINATSVYMACLILYAVSAFWLLRLRSNQQPIQEGDLVTMESVLAGVVYVWKNKVILGSITLDLFAVLLGGATALLPIYAKDILHTGPLGLGLLRAAPAVGALMISLYLTRWPLKGKVGRYLFGSIALFGIATFVFALSENFVLSLIALMISGCADMVSVVIRHTIVQLETPENMRGRVSAVNTVFVGASNQLGEFESGATAEWFGPVPAVVIGGLGTVFIAVLWSFLFKTLYNRDQLVSTVEAKP